MSPVLFVSSRVDDVDDFFVNNSKSSLRWDDLGVMKYVVLLLPYVKYCRLSYHFYEKRRRPC